MRIPCSLPVIVIISSRLPTIVEKGQRVDACDGTLEAIDSARMGKRKAQNRSICAPAHIYGSAGRNGAGFRAALPVS
jgi:hypothetical protein